MIHCRVHLRCLLCFVFCFAGTRSSSYLPSNAGMETLYSDWSQWTACTSSCDLGITTRTRSCLKSAYNSKGVYVPVCRGEYSEHKLCNLRNCPPNALRARDVQCSQHNNRTVAGKLVKEWIPAEKGANPCELRCKGKSEGLEYGFGKVSNGTPCPQGVCLDGRCLGVGCDDRLGSEVVSDMCGVCGGRNSSCVHYMDVFLGQPPADSGHRSGYHEVVVLPVRTRNLKIHQLVGKNYLALQDRTRGIIFNGEQHLTRYGGHFAIAGTTVQFEKSDNTTEILTAKGPLTEELYILVLLRTFNQGIYYEYWLPKQTQNPVRSQHSLRRMNNSYLSTATVTGKPNQHTEPVYTEHHRPTKPAYAYGYGEKPYRIEEAPVFRHIITSSKPKHTPVAQSYALPNTGANAYTGRGSTGPPYIKDSYSLYNPRSHKPAVGYYQTFRNVSKDNTQNDLDQELPVLTQPDLNGNDNKYDNSIPTSILDKRKHRFTAPKSQRSILEISKRGEKGQNYVTNGRLKYSFETKDTDHVHASNYTPSALAIALLPFSSKKKKNEARCPPCERSRDQIKQFCGSDFVIRGLVIRYEFLHGETRYELEVKQTFKNTLSLLPKEYIWSPDTCRCPKLRPGKEYVIMGRIDNNYKKRESRLLIDRNCFVRTFNLKYARRLQKLRKDSLIKCTISS